MLPHYKIYFILFLLICLPACEGEKEFYTGTPEKKLAGIKLIVGAENTPGQAISSRSVQNSGISIEYTNNTPVQTRSIASDPDYQLRDIVVLQFDEAEDLITFEYIDDLYLSEVEVSGTELIYTREITLEEANSCTVFVIANTGAPEVFHTIQTLDEMEGYTRLLPDESAMLVSGFIPMTGKYTGPVDDETGIRITLERMFAKFEVTVNTGNLSGGRTLSLEKIQLKSVPTVALYAHIYKNYNFNSDYTIQGYPLVPNNWLGSIDTGLFTDYSAIDIVEGDKQTFYMAENIRGRGYNSGGDPVSQQNKYADYDATTIYENTWQGLNLNDYELGVCSRFWLTGKYTTPDDGEMNILITLYPGDDIYNDFNVRRNTLYNMTVNIRDIDPLHVPSGQTPGEDGRIYVWKDNGSVESRTMPDPPVIGTIYESRWGEEARLTTSFYLDPIDNGQIEKVEIVVISQSGIQYSVECPDYTSSDGENFTTTSSVSVYISEALNAGDMVMAFTRLTMKDGRVLNSDSSMTFVRGPY